MEHHILRKYKRSTKSTLTSKNEKFLILLGRFDTENEKYMSCLSKNPYDCYLFLDKITKQNTNVQMSLPTENAGNEKQYLAEPELTNSAILSENSM